MTATLIVYAALWSYVAPWHLPVHTAWYWVVLMLVVDLAWYCNHRFSHRVRIGWAAHHSSEYFNLGTALRQKWNPWSEAIFWAPLPLLGFAPWTIYLIRLQYHEYSNIFADVRRADRLRDKLGYVFAPPVWQPRDENADVPSPGRPRNGHDIVDDHALTRENR